MIHIVEARTSVILLALMLDLDGHAWQLPQSG